MSEKVIEVKNAVKKFKDTTALDNVTVSFDSGKIHGIIGRNGSGKTVLFKCICGLMKLTDGEIYVNDKKVSGIINNDIGVIIEEPGFVGSMSGKKNLSLLASINKKIDDKEVERVIELVGLDPKSRKHVKKYSMGMKQRLGIAQAIMENPSILILDEPMNGLDNKGVEDIRKLLLELKEQGKTILIASHSRDDIAVLCDNVYEMDHGVMTQIKSCEEEAEASAEE